MTCDGLPCIFQTAVGMPKDEESQWTRTMALRPEVLTRTPLPDLSRDGWPEKFAKVPVRRGVPVKKLHRPAPTTSVALPVNETSNRTWS